MKKLIALILTSAMVLMFTVPAFASSTDKCYSSASALRYNVIRTYSGTIKVSGTTATMATSVRLYDDYTVCVVLELERSKDGVNWDYECVMGEYEETARTHAFNSKKSGLSSSYEYRVVGYLDVYDEYGDHVDYDVQEWYFTV